MNRVIKVWIEMELVEGEHFNLKNKEWNDEEARQDAEFQFQGMLDDPDIGDYVQSSILLPNND